MTTDTTSASDWSAPRPRWTHRALWTVQIVVIVGIVGTWLWSRRPQAPAPEPLPIHGAVPAFALTDAGGQEVTLDDLHGEIWIADFIFTRCGGQCLNMTSRMRDLEQAMQNDPNVRFVSISVDPYYDTPETLRRYTQRHQLDTKRWIFLTGSEEAIHTLARDGFRLAAAESSEEEKADGAEDFIHSVRFVLVDGQGQIRGYYNALDSDDLHALLTDARRLARGPAA